MDFQIGGLFTESAIGIGTMLLATICYGFSSQYTKRHLQQISISVLAFFSLVIGGAIALIGMAVSGQTLAISEMANIYVLLSVIGLGCFGSGIAHLLFYFMVKEASAEFATSVTYIIPISAMVWGHVLLNEPVTGNLLSGLLFIFLGVFLATRKRASLMKKEEKQAG